MASGRVKESTLAASTGPVVAGLDEVGTGARAHAEPRREGAPEGVPGVRAYNALSDPTVPRQQKTCTAAAHGRPIVVCESRHRKEDCNQT